MRLCLVGCNHSFIHYGSYSFIISPTNFDVGKRCPDFWRFAFSKENTRQNLPSCSSSPTKNASQILVARRRIVRTKREEKKRRSGGEI